MTPAVLTRWSPAPTLLPSVPVEQWPIVELAGERWRVAPVPWAPIAIGDAPAVAEAYGCELPTKELVDAIAKAATVRVEPTPIRNTPDVTINCQRHAWIVAGQLAGVEPEQLVVGTHKDHKYQERACINPSTETAATVAATGDGDASDA